MIQQYIYYAQQVLNYIEILIYIHLWYKLLDNIIDKRIYIKKKIDTTILSFMSTKFKNIFLIDYLKQIH